MVNPLFSSNLFPSLIGFGRIDRALTESAAIVSSGLRVNSIDDDVGAFVRNITLSNRATQLDVGQSAISNAIASIDAGISAIEGLIEVFNSQREIAASVIANGTSTAATMAFTTLNNQHANITSQANIDGANFLGTAGATNNVTLIGVIGTGMVTLSALDVANVVMNFGAFTSPTTVTAANTAITEIDAALDTLNGLLAQAGAFKSFLETAASVNEEVQLAIEEAATEIVEADLEKESANLTALQTQRDVALTVIGIVSASQRSVLAIFR